MCFTYQPVSKQQTPNTTSSLPFWQRLIHDMEVFATILYASLIKEISDGTDAHRLVRLLWYLEFTRSPVKGRL